MQATKAGRGGLGTRLYPGRAHAEGAHATGAGLGVATPLLCTINLPKKKKNAVSIEFQIDQSYSAKLAGLNLFFTRPIAF